MIIKNSQQDIHIVEDESTTTLGYKVSGGADSAIVGYMLSKFVVEERPDIKIMPITTTLAGKQYQLIYAKRVLEFLKNEFGDIFVEHQTSHASQLNKYVSSHWLMKQGLIRQQRLYIVALLLILLKKYIDNGYRIQVHQITGMEKNFLLKIG